MPLSPRVPDLAALDLLLSVVELGSLGRAAQAHGISQPSASSRIRTLEKLVGVPVLERSTLGSRPTRAGELIVEWARAVIDAASRLDTGIETLRTEHRSQLRVAASQTIAEYLLPQWLTNLRAAAPDLSIALDSGNSADMAQAVLDGRAAIGFVESRQHFDSLDSRVIARDRLVVAVAPGHRWARRGTVDVDELAATPLLQRESGSGTRDWFEDCLARQYPGARPAPAALQLSSTTAIKAAVAAGAGPAILSSLAVAAEAAAGTLVIPTITGLELDRVLRAVWPAGTAPKGPARDLVTIAHRSGIGSGEPHQ
ncbi:LysR family transcriptional regulator [Nocardia halotolerans]|uniref:LysR family transcriptional regulator n=1 Tax=Nocardia halotolerans TaxID=1755878 RepID=A0ABV8VMM3_9NOCA